MNPACVMIGGGGHARVVLDALRLQGKFRVTGLTEIREVSNWDVPWLGDEEILPVLRKKGVRFFVVGVGGVPDNAPRAALFWKGVEAGLDPAIVVHPSAVVASGVALGAGTVVLARSVINPMASLGVNIIINTAAVVEHDVRIADHAHISPGSILCGGVEVGEGAFIGAGAVVREKVRIGAWAVVGAGAVVLRDVPARGRVAGVPARPMGKKR